MLIITYDISETKVRTKFSKFLEKFGRRIQLSVFEVKNSKRFLDNIIVEIENKYKPMFTGADSVLIFQLGGSPKIHRFGYAANEEEKIVFF